MKHVWRAGIRIATAVAALALGSCSGPTRFVDPEADLPFYETVGIVPFVSLAEDRAAGYRVSSICFTELLDRDFARVVEPGQFQAAIREIRGGTAPDAPWSSADLIKLGEKTGVQGFLMGTVHEYGMRQTGKESFPILSLELHLVDAATGRVVWSASKTRKGGPGVPIFGFGEVHTLGELTSQVCRELLATLPKA